jgi:hypothetical protein
MIDYENYSRLGLDQAYPCRLAFSYFRDIEFMIGGKSYPLEPEFYL